MSKKKVQGSRLNLGWKTEFVFKQHSKIYQCCVRILHLHCSKTWELTVSGELRLRGMERRLIRMMSSGNE